MNTHRLIRTVFATCAVVVSSIMGVPDSSAGSADGDTRAIPTPAKPGSRLPNLTVLADGKVIMSWIEPAADSSLALRCATYDGARWTPPATIAEGDSFFANWADFPSIRALGGSRVAAHWLWKSGAAKYAYDVRVSHSDDGGLHWRRPVTPHRDATATEHGFVSLVPSPDGVFATWLDGRKGAGYVEETATTTPDMTVRSAIIGFDGGLSQEFELDDRACDCCQTAAAATDRGMLVAYRDRGPDEIRDIFVTRLEQGRWTEPRAVHADGWHIAGCPVNGPALDALGSHVALAWFTAAADTPRVLFAFSEDAGKTFGPPVRLDDGDPLGRVHVALLEDGSALVTWLESKGKQALVRARRVWLDGTIQPAFTVARTSASRASGFPRLARAGSRVYFAWTETGTRSRIRVASTVIR